MKYQVIRLSTSTYHEKNFIEKEKTLIESLGDINYQFGVKDFKDLPSILISNSHTKYDEIPSDLLKNTKLIIHPNSGYDNVDLSLSKKGIVLVGGNDIRKLPVSEWIFGALFQHYAPIPFRFDWDPGRKWDRKLVSQQNILILGLGHIGETVYNTLKAFAPNLKVYDPKESCEHSINSLEAIQDGEIDCAIFCCSLTDSSREILNSSFLRMLPEDGVIINPSRGKTINQADLEKHLEANPNFTAYLDVFPTEPLPDGHFSQRNVFKSSHVAGCHLGLDNHQSQYCHDVINDFINFESGFHNKYKRVILNG